MTTKVVGATKKPVSVKGVASAKESVQNGDETAEAKATLKEKKQAAADQFAKADVAATPEQQAETRLGLAIRGY